MINYIKNTNLGGTIFPMHKVTAKSALGSLKKICEANLFDLDSYLKQLRKHVKVGYKAPVFVNQTNVFFYIKALNDYENIFVNYYQISNVETKDNLIEIKFKNNDTLLLEISMKTYKRLVITIFNLYSYKESLV